MRRPGRRPAAAVGVAVAATGLLWWLTPGGTPRASGAVEVTSGASVSLYRSLAGTAADAPGWVGTALGLATEGTLVVLGLLLVWTGWRGLRRGDARTVAAVVLAGVATVVAYGISEILKTMVDEERPCRALSGVTAVAPCPGVGDWSFPSNHSTLAVAIAVGVALARPRLAAVTLPLGAAGALLRVAVGVHYPHDVLAGSVLGASAALVLFLALLPVTVGPVARLTSRFGPERGAQEIRGRHTRFVGHDGGRGPVVDAQPGQYGADVRFDGAFHHVQTPRDLPVGQPGGHMGQHVPLAGGEGRDPLPGGGAPAGGGPGAGRGEMGHHPGGDLR